MADEHVPRLSGYQAQQANNVPDGFDLLYTPKGIPYLKKKDDNGDEEAANEHTVEKLSLLVSMEEIERRYGIGTRLYYNFLKYVMITNFVLFLIMVPPYVLFLTKRTGDWSIGDLFVGAYGPDQRTMWIAFNCVSILATFLFGPIYYLYVVRILGNNKDEDHDNLFAGSEFDQIPENVRYTSHQRFVRRTGMYIVFAFLIFVSGGLTYGIQTGGVNSPYTLKNPSPFNPVTLAVTASVTIVNLIFQKLSFYMTSFERHRTWSTFRKHNTIKLLSFKMINVTGLYIALAFVRETGCSYHNSGSKFLTLILIDLFLGNTIEYVLAYGKIFLSKHFQMFAGKGGDEANKPEFDVAEEYLEVFYRQFLIYFGTAVFPMMPLLGLVTNIIEYPLDKFRMLRMCQRPKRIDLSMKRLILIWMFVTAAAALVVWPQGAAYVLSNTKNTSYPRGLICCDVLRGEVTDMNRYIEAGSCISDSII
eukprot:TRINITY_DN5760_c0_g1_i6.p1 TRINITY_DN5760_c0_g1~~TRINITY_DN5760_c0_g1_i6.p1  ORF type:complete len:475 (+),score=127.46 TRINITY_DN5760_c0_g1_i6:1444-2868(+)